MVDSQQPEEQQLPDKVAQACANPECCKEATMQCPTCIKLGLEPTFFCDQECFTKFWKFHKLCHVKKDDKKEASIDSKYYKGSLRPYPYSFRGMRHVPDDIKKPDYAKTGKPNASF